MSMYSLLKKDIRDVVIQSLSEYPSTEVIYSHLNGSEPSGSYCTIGKLTVRQTTRASNSSPMSDLISQTEVGYEVFCTVSFIGQNAGDLCFSSHVRLGNTESNREASQIKNLSVSSKSPVQAIPYPRGTKYIDVFSYDVSFYFIWGVTEEVDPIEQVVIINSDYSETITIPPQI